MKEKKGTPNRHSIPLREYDYSKTGAYFVTICSCHRECLWGEIVKGEVRLSEAGQIVKARWEMIPTRYPQSTLDRFVIMPNHIHGIILIDVGAIHESPLRIPSKLISRRKMLLPKIIGYFKMNTAKHINLLRGKAGKPIWQRNYYEHVIRNEYDLDEIRQYIENNPLKWLEDEDHPSNIKL